MIGKISNVFNDKLRESLNKHSEDKKLLKIMTEMKSITYCQ